ncbi:dihydrofolate reductase family protein [Nocardia inohanensis]|uniref:dihydrofolate reductase family protein n=1 Tax=Nocardia inohanensis TaxID=209246 RepID=UPI000829DE1E|nr:dihydrofolate reductase family protein [Nocardia inohanensis]
MRKLTAGFFISLDGVVADPQDWHFPYFDDAMGEAVTAQLGGADTLLLGRVTYDSFAGAWPERENAGGDDAGMAKALGDARKIVVTHQDPDFTWRNSEKLRGDLVEAVDALKREPGETGIAISGSPSVVRQLLAAGLIDELHLLVHPLTVGKGARLFEDGQSIPLRLLSATPFPSGVVHAIYGPAEAPAAAGYDEARTHLAQGDR